MSKSSSQDYDNGTATLRKPRKVMRACVPGDNITVASSVVVWRTCDACGLMLLPDESQCLRCAGARWGGRL